ncbi:hypothetical protein LJC27_07095, partial [Christensenellaceae bacterium OttesenSCG-928-M15]|nr:hypothetical protein [Christensenellaceae bacterium OttesenSCG-928-M15]
EKSGLDKIMLQDEKGKEIKEAVIERKGGGASDRYEIDLSGCVLTGGSVTLVAADMLDNRTKVSLGRLMWDKDAPVIRVEHENAAQTYFLPRRIDVVDEGSGVESTYLKGALQNHNIMRTDMHWYEAQMDAVDIRVKDYVGNEAKYTINMLPIPDPRAIEPGVDEEMLLTVIEQIEEERALLTEGDPFHLTGEETLRLQNTLSALRWELSALKITKGIYPVLTEEYIKEAERLLAVREDMHQAVKSLLNEALCIKVREIVTKAALERISAAIDALPDTPVSTWDKQQIKTLEDTVIACCTELTTAERDKLDESITKARNEKLTQSLQQLYLQAGISATCDLKTDSGIDGEVIVLGLLSRLSDVPQGATVYVWAEAVEGDALERVHPAYEYLGGYDVRVMAQAAGQEPFEVRVKPGEQLFVLLPAALAASADESTMKVYRGNGKQVEVLQAQTIRQEQGVSILTGEMGRFEQYTLDASQEYDLWGRPVIQEQAEAEAWQAAASEPKKTPAPQKTPSPLPAQEEAPVMSPALENTPHAQKSEKPMEEPTKMPVAVDEKQAGGAENWPLIVILGVTLLIVALRILVGLKGQKKDEE